MHLVQGWPEARRSHRPMCVCRIEWLARRGCSARAYPRSRYRRDLESRIPQPRFAPAMRRVGHIDRRMKAAQAGQVRKPWDLGVSEQPLTNRFLKQRRLPVICHPMEGELAVTAARSKMGRLMTRCGR